ncbi:hypothetical protein DPMN_008558 [Dreissena polymorpha]|uniref:Uncharacterized protein n=1 Tax=Dreissena polymorpha TaxID=45954 RepID=A0A9D4MYL8_DREPO|nr:hypothetical protein DPMN_008558 [Dreissena polymorpha]
MTKSDITDNDITNNQGLWFIKEITARVHHVSMDMSPQFHEERKINVASRVFTRKNAPPPGSHVFQPTGIIFELIQDIIRMNLLTKFHEDRIVNVASRVLTRFYYCNVRKNAPPLGSHFVQANIIIFELIQDIIETNLLTKFHDDWTINVASRVLTRFYYSHIKPYKEKCPAPVGHVFKAAKTIFELIQDIIGTNLLTKFHDDRKINVTSRVLTRKIAPPLWPYIIGMNLLTKKNVPPLGSYVFQAKVTIFELIKDISGTNLLSKFHEDRKINEKCPAPGGHDFQPTDIIFELFQDFIGMNLLTKFHEDQTINVASRVLTRFNYSHIRKNAPPLGSHVFQANVTIFELIQDIIETNLLTKFHEDWTINVASRE